jgi:8-oxo-dGTP diphosphatase
VRDDCEPTADGVATPLETVAAVLLLRDDGAALLQHRDDKPNLPRAGMWVPPGGHCEPGEDVAACARRELYEETAYDCADLRPLTAFLDEREGGWPPNWLVVFWARYDGVQPLECREGQALEFVERRRASEYPIPANLLATWDQALSQSRQPGKVVEPC